jgi:Ca-activated chloride channel family protein
VEVIPATGVTIQGVEMARFAFNRDRVHVPLGSMHGGQQRELLLRVNVDAHAMGRKPLASVRFHFKDPTEGGLQRVHEAVVAAQVTDSPGLVAQHAIARTSAMVAMRSASDLAREASEQANAGNLDLAMSRLDRAESELRKNAERSKDKREKKRLTRQADNMGRLKRDVATASRSAGPNRKAKSREAALEINAEAMAADGY